MKNKQYKVINSDTTPGLIIKILKELQGFPGYYICQFVTGNEDWKPGWNTSFNLEELEEL